VTEKNGVIGSLSSMSTGRGVLQALETILRTTSRFWPITNAISKVARPSVALDLTIAKARWACQKICTDHDAQGTTSQIID
jgi:hypothetical protein